MTAVEVDGWDYDVPDDQYDAGPENHDDFEDFDIDGANLEERWKSAIKSKLESDGNKDHLLALFPGSTERLYGNLSRFQDLSTEAAQIYGAGPPGAVAEGARLTSAQREAATSGSGEELTRTSDEADATHNAHQTIEQLQIERDDPSKSHTTRNVIITILSLLGTAAVLGIIGRVIRQRNLRSANDQPAAPTDVVATTSKVEGKSRIDVSWTPSAGDPSPSKYRVTLAGSVTDNVPPPIDTVDANVTTALFDNVPDGVWTVKVSGVVNDVVGTAGSSNEVTLPIAEVVPATPPTPVTDIVVSSSMSQRTVKWGITATWTPGDDAAETFTAELVDVATGTAVQSDTVMSASARFDSAPAGLYIVRVTATNAAGSSTPVSSGQLDHQLPPPPATPTGITATATNEAGALTATLLVAWDQPDNDDVATTLVRLSGQGDYQLTVIGTSRMATIDDVVPGDYTVEVTARNAGGSSTASIDYTLELDAKGSDIILKDYFSDQDVDAFATVQTNMATLTQPEFWTKVITALQDAGDGTPADFDTQLAIVDLLIEVMVAPASRPKNAQIATLATRLAAATDPAFPTAPGTPYTGDQLALWTAASTIKNQMGTADVALPAKLYGLSEALAKFLGEPGHVG